MCNWITNEFFVCETSIYNRSYKTIEYKILVYIIFINNNIIRVYHENKIYQLVIHLKTFYCVVVQVYFRYFYFIYTESYHRVFRQKYMRKKVYTIKPKHNNKQTNTKVWHKYFYSHTRHTSLISNKYHVHVNV